MLSLVKMSDFFENPVLRVSSQMLLCLLLNKGIKRQVDLRLFAVICALAADHM